jgi:hypothetical protein
MTCRVLIIGTVLALSGSAWAVDGGIGGRPHDVYPTAQRKSVHWGTSFGARGEAVSARREVKQTRDASASTSAPVDLNQKL